MKRRSRGFTLAEMAIVLAIIGLIVAGVSVGRGMLENARAAAVVSMANDATTAVKGFKERYRYNPGDMPLAGVISASLVGTCNMAVAGTVGNGIIDTATEISCAVDELYLTGFLRADQDPAAAGRFVLNTAWGPATVRAASMSAANNFPVGANVIEFVNLPCAVVRQIDVKIDDGDIASTGPIEGRAKASVATCTEGGANDPVPAYSVRLN